MPMKSIFARQIFDSRGNPTVEVDLITDLGLFRAAVPSGASTDDETYILLEVKKAAKRKGKKGKKDKKGKKGKKGKKDKKAKEKKGKGKGDAKGKKGKKGKGKKGKGGAPVAPPEPALPFCPPTEPAPPEAQELRDEDTKNYHGRSVLKACNNINEIIGPELLRKCFEVIQQEEIDDFLIKLDGTESKAYLGANAILAVSLAVAKAGAAKRGVPLYRHIAELAGNRNIILPVPSFAAITGGKLAPNKLAMQEFSFLPTGANTFSEAMKMGSEIYHHLKNIIRTKMGLESLVVCDEGGFAPKIDQAKQALDLIVEAIERAGYTGRVDIGIDVAATDFFKSGKYNLDFKSPKPDPTKLVTAEKLLTQYSELIAKYPVLSIEDPFDQNHWEAWTKFTENQTIQIVGDSLTISNIKRISMAIGRKAGNALSLKVNQVGTITEVIRAHLLARANGWGSLVADRSGDTEDTFIADLVVGLSTGQIKAGAPCRSERCAKYNQILRIEEELGANAKFAGKSFRRPS